MDENWLAVHMLPVKVFAVFGYLDRGERKIVDMLVLGWVRRIDHGYNILDPIVERDGTYIDAVGNDPSFITFRYEGKGADEIKGDVDAFFASKEAEIKKKQLLSGK